MVHAPSIAVNIFTPKLQGLDLQRMKANTGMAQKI